ncbi:hypothetical protein AS9A_4468 [Hoyosella subflava DQS3-9A1]|uniref:Uncharacterized protein n=1 Tax=Hoyosella subflava (strain DSM 45089 / JCM 17490 / NBRC 109087 / DQS3-9A1) TaxID=443218 RepID=F6ENP4_HOYSD|nr:hypothetical protein AS9A_4468 [Hoyosella subflava DQS3-9A1]
MLPGNAQFIEVGTALETMSYWYPWQVTCLGLGQVWQGDNADG